MKTWIQQAFAPVRRILPLPVAEAVRSTGTALIGPFRNAYRSGFIRSSFANRAVDRNGNPLPWYTYPSIDFLKTQDFEGKRVLEFGCGQSTPWWASRAAHVVGIEENVEWAKAIASRNLPNVTVKHVPRSTPNYRDHVLAYLEGQTFDVIIIDGGNRSSACKCALSVLAPGGAIICDNAEGYGMFDALRDSGLMRVDFYGSCPGVVLPHFTSIFFGPDCWMFRNGQKPQRPDEP